MAEEEGTQYNNMSVAVSEWVSEYQTEFFRGAHHATLIHISHYYSFLQNVNVCVLVTVELTVLNTVSHNAVSLPWPSIYIVNMHQAVITV